jgi:hypothetical protein
MSDMSKVSTAVTSDPARADPLPEWWSEVADRFTFLGVLGWNESVTTASPDPRPTLHRVAGNLGELVTDLAGASVVAPLFETKVAAGLALEIMSDAYAVMTRRLLELRITPPVRPVADPIVEGARAWPSATKLLRTAAALRQDCEAVAEHANVLCDRPTVRLIGDDVLPVLRTVERLLGDLLESGLDGADLLENMAARDARYETFNETRDYAARASDYDVDGPMSADFDALVGQLRTQRDELDAVETFGRLVAAVDLSPADLRGVCRIVGDEARHTLMGEIALKICGLDPFRIPVGTIGAELRRTLDPWDGLAQICLIGESGNQQAIDQGARLAEKLGFDVVARMLDTIYQDERFHIIFGIRLLAKRHPQVTPADLRQRALDLSNQYLQARGIDPVDLKDAGRLLGE